MEKTRRTKRRASSNSAANGITGTTLQNQFSSIIYDKFAHMIVKEMGRFHEKSDLFNTVAT